MEEVLEIHDLKTYYRTFGGFVKAVDGVDLNVSKGKSIGIVGESGCGKTTVALSIVRLLPSECSISGEIVFKGTDLLKLGEESIRRVREKKISIVFQNPMTYLNPVIRIGSLMIEIVREHETIGKPESRRKVIEALKAVGLPSPDTLINSYPHQLSGGMRQRVLIASALLCRPQLVILDEPTTALDVTTQARILHDLKKILSELELSTVLITHDLGIVAHFCDNVYVMYGGKIVEHNDVYGLFNNPKHPYTIRLLDAVKSVQDFKGEYFTIDGVVPSLENPPSGCRFHPRCPYAKPVCKRESPKMINIEGEHQVACWLFD